MSAGDLNGRNNDRDNGAHRGVNRLCRRLRNAGTGNETEERSAASCYPAKWDGVPHRRWKSEGSKKQEDERGRKENSRAWK